MNAFLQQLAERQRFGIKPGLDAIQSVLPRLGNPEHAAAAIHIAGTNGKGSVAAMCESVLRHAGYPVGRYTSPHLIAVNERILVNGQPVTDDALEAAAREVDDAACGIDLTYFEYLTALAFVVFRNEGIKLAVIETGLGGRLDATNVVFPLVSVITRIGLDHCEWLGGTIAQIAREKAGIIKPGQPAVCGAMPEEARAVIRETAAQQGAALIDATETVSVTATKHALDGQTLKIATQAMTLPPVRLPLAGAFQAENAATAVAALETAMQYGLDIPEAAFVKGLAAARWPGRFHLVSATPPVIVDGAHNPDGARALAHALKTCGIKGNVGLVAGFCADKDAVSFLRVLAPIVKRAWAVTVPNPRSRTAEETASHMREAGIREIVAPATLSAAITQAQTWANETGGTIVICGSLFLAGAALSFGQP
ncbi:MAG: bifunctional folylpolyglutamate synthase/dihydrofolate synthase [Kiritimatiellaeota bacterium]|nr:bifunctional folylpolyglutamate synthase/dihydrofolate synthase [Kiritimatiellota bacterium]